MLKLMAEMISKPMVKPQLTAKPVTKPLLPMARQLALKMMSTILMMSNVTADDVINGINYAIVATNKVGVTLKLVPSKKGHHNPLMPGEIATPSRLALL